MPRRRSRGAPCARPRVRIPRRTRNASNGPSVRAGVDLDLPDLGDELGAAGDDAGDDVAVAAQELRRRFDDEVRAELERPADVRRGERVVDDVRRAVLVGELGDRRVVGHDGRRVGDGLGVDDVRSARPAMRRGHGGRCRSCRRSRPGRRTARSVDAAASASSRRPPAGATTRSPARSCDARAAWIAPMPDATARPASRARELGVGIAERAAVGLARRRVRVPGARVGDDVAELLGVGRGEGRGLVDRHGSSAAGRRAGRARRPGSRAWRSPCSALSLTRAMLHRAWPSARLT